MNVLKYAMLRRFALASLLLLCFSTSHAQWDWEYQIGVQMTQRPYSNSLTETSSGIYGVSNDLTGTGFWIHTTDVFGKTAASFYYSSVSGTLKVHSIEVWNSTLITAGEIDNGNGTKDIFLMSSDVTGGVNAAVRVSYGSNTISTAVDLVTTSSTATTANFMAIGYLDNSPTSKIPCSVMFDHTMGAFSAKQYDPGTGSFFIPTQAKLLDPNYASNRVIVVGNDESNSSKRIFRMKINTNNGNQSGSFRSHYISTTTDLYNPSVSTTVGTNNVLIACTYSSTVTDAVLMRFTGNPGVNPTTVVEYDKNGESEAPIQIHETTTGIGVIAYNYQESNGDIIPCVAMIDMSSPSTVLSDIEYHTKHDQRRMFAASPSGPASTTMHFECTTPNDDITRTVASSTMTPCEITGDFDYLAAASVLSPATTGTTTTTTYYDDLIVDEATVTGARYDCDGNYDGSFKRSTSVGPLADPGTLLKQVSEGIFVLQSTEVSTYRIFDLNGQLISENMNAVQGSQIDLVALPKGIYLLSATTVTGAQTQLKIAR